MSQEADTLLMQASSKKTTGAKRPAAKAARAAKSDAARPKPRSKTSRAGLQFPVGRIKSSLRNGRYAGRISDTAAVFTAAVLEYLAAELLELSGNVARDDKKVRINPRHLMLAGRSDDEFCNLLASSFIQDAGETPMQLMALRNPRSKLKFKEGPKGEAVPVAAVE